MLSSQKKNITPEKIVSIVTKRLKSSSGPRRSKQKSCKITNCWLVGLLSERTLGRCTPFKDHWHKARKKSAWRTPWDWRKNNVPKGSTNWSTSWNQVRWVEKVTTCWWIPGKRNPRVHSSILDDLRMEMRGASQSIIQVASFQVADIKYRP